MKRILFIATAFTFAVSASAQNGGIIKLEKGKKYKVENKITTNNVTDVQGQQVESNVDVSVTYNMEIADFAGDRYTIKSTLSSVRMKANMMGQEFNYDSDDPSSSGGPLSVGVADIVGKQTTIVVDNSGRPVEEEKEKKSEVSSLVNQFGSADYMVKSVVIALPSNLKVGDTWNVSDPETAPVANNITYTVKSIDGNVATLAFTGTTKSKTTVENSGMEIHTNSSGKVEGEVTVDKSTGLVKGNKSTSESTGSVEMMGQEFPLQANMASETTVSEVK